MAAGKGKAVGTYLSAEDENVLRNFVSEFVGQKLVPHLEAVLKNLNEWVRCVSCFFHTLHVCYHFMYSTYT